MEKYADKDKIVMVAKAYAGQFKNNFKNLIGKTYEEANKEDCFNPDYLTFFIKSNSDAKVRNQNTDWFNKTFTAFYGYTVNQNVFKDLFGSEALQNTTNAPNETIEDDDSSCDDNIADGLFGGDDGW